MADVTAPSSSNLRRRALPAGAALLATEALGLANIPAASTLAQHAQDWLKSLKAPGHNDQDARGLMSRIEQYISLVEAADAVVSTLDTAHQGEGTATFLYQLRGFHDYLCKTRVELRGLQVKRPTVKFACQKEIKNRLDDKQDELLSQAILFCLKNGLLANQTAAQSQERQCNSEERLSRLEYEVSMLPQARRTDERPVKPNASYSFVHMFFPHICQSTATVLYAFLVSKRRI
ncbi:hypothetical protein FRC09_012812 [Ceratobasidium sp. 395]|nr:hypothetical protein FRC09_012812 [Ceratobasidium sp. 395]